MLKTILLIAAVIVTGAALFQWAGRLNAFGYAHMETAARHSSARIGNTILAIALWLGWAYV